MVTSKIFFALLAATMTVSAAAQTAAPAPSTTNADTPIIVDGQAQKAAKPICRYEETGSLIPKKVCLTRQQWAEVEKNNQRTLDEIRRGASTRCRVGGIC